MSDTLAELEAIIAGMSKDELAELDSLLADELKAKWLPNPGPQSDAYFSEADVLLYGGAAGGGKSDLLLGLALTEHKRTVIFRRAYVDLRGIEERLIEINGSRQGYNGHDMVYRRDGRLIEFGALEKPGAEFSWQGRPHDLIAVDEGAQLTAAKVSFVLGWLRSVSEGQRCRMVIASNPPMGGDGAWLLDWFAPWLDPLFANPAQPCEVRWGCVVGEKIEWVDGPGVYTFDDDEYTAMSWTYVPALLEDNPYLKDTGYRTRLQNLPEPLRSQLLKGDFLAGREDHEWQVIPSEWIRLAQERWEAAPVKKRRMLALSADVAIGGKDNAALAPLYDEAWFGPVLTRKGADIQDPAQIATWMIQTQKDACDLSVDGTGGWGSGVKSKLMNDHKMACESIVYSASATKRSRDNEFGFHNLRAQMYWLFREALDPELGDDIMLPPDRGLTAELTAPRWSARGTNILVEEKAEIKKRIGRSTDKSDAIVQAWHRREQAMKNRVKQAKANVSERESSGSGNWMAG